MATLTDLTEKQRRFVQNYTGNATEAAKLAGYSPKSAKVTGSRLLSNAIIKKAIDSKVSKQEETRKDLHEELYTFWRMMVREADGDNNRLKASELLAKAESMFLQRIKDETDYTGLSEDEMLLEVLNDPESREKVVKVFAALGYKVIAIT